MQSIVISSQTSPTLPTTFQPADSLPSSLFSTISGVTVSKSILPAATLTNAGLSTLSLAANATITVQPGAQVTLNPGGTFQAIARRIENYGGITAPGGNITLSLQTDLTTNAMPDANGNPTNTNYIPLNEVIYLAGGSSLNAAGERIDDTGAANSSSGIATSGYLNGGSVKVMEQSVTGQGVFVAPSALIDVSGGWQISTAGKVTGGDAGSITLQGSTLVVDGILRGASLIGNKGGSITMTAPNIAIEPPPEPSRQASTLI